MVEVLRIVVLVAALLFTLLACTGAITNPVDSKKHFETTSISRQANVLALGSGVFCNWK